MTITCSGCDKELIVVQSCKGASYLKRMIVRCPFCLDKSYVQEIGNKYSIFLCPGVDLVDLNDSDEENCLVEVFTARIDQ